MYMRAYYNVVCFDDFSLFNEHSIAVITPCRMCHPFLTTHEFMLCITNINEFTDVTRDIFFPMRRDLDTHKNLDFGSTSAIKEFV